MFETQKIIPLLLCNFRFKMWTGLGRGVTTISPAELEKERRYRELEDQIEQFPDQIDR